MDLLGKSARLDSWQTRRLFSSQQKNIKTFASFGGLLHMLISLNSFPFVDELKFNMPTLRLLAAPDEKRRETANLTGGQALILACQVVFDL